MNKRARVADANIAFVIAVAVNAFFFVMEKYGVGEVWAAWQWYPLVDVIVTFAVGGVLSLRRPVGAGIGTGRGGDSAPRRASRADGPR